MARHNFLGERYLKDYERKLIRRELSNFLFRPVVSSEKLFSPFWTQMKKQDSGCEKYLSEIEILDLEKWNDKANAIVTRIKIFEKRLEEEIENQNKRYINDAFKVIEKKFRYNVRNINIKKEDVFSQFTEALNNSFSAIREQFDKSDDGFIRMFALPISIGHDELVPIAWSGAEFEKRNEAKFHIKLLKGIENTLDIEDKKIRTDEQRKIIFKAASQDIKNRFDEARDFFLPGWLAGNEVAYIVWKRHGNKLRPIGHFAGYDTSVIPINTGIADVSTF